MREPCDFEWTIVFSVFLLNLSFLLRLKYKVFFSKKWHFLVKIGRMIVRFVIYMEVFFLQIFDTFKKIKNGHHGACPPKRFSGVTLPYGTFTLGFQTTCDCLPHH
jgi:hypothetical protein